MNMQGDIHEAKAVVGFFHSTHLKNVMLLCAAGHSVAYDDFSKPFFSEKQLSLPLCVESRSSSAVLRIVNCNFVWLIYLCKSVAVAIYKNHEYSPEWLNFDYYGEKKKIKAEEYCWLV